MPKDTSTSDNDVPSLELDSVTYPPQIATNIDTRRHNMGKGLKALSHIPAGTLIISEPPLFTAPPSFFFSPPTPAGEKLVTSHISTLSSAQKSSWSTLSSYHPFIALPSGSHISSPNLSRFKTSAIPLFLGARRRRISQFGVFGSLSWANHSCHHNAQHTWNSSTHQLDLYALRDISVGEAITINYAPENIISRLYIWLTYRFKCFCAWCEADVGAEERRVSNGNRRRIGDGLLYVSREPDVGLAMRAAYDVLALLIVEEVRDFRLGLLFSDCFDAAVETGDMERARVLGGLAVKAFRHCEGDGDSVRMVKRELGRLMKSEVGVETREEKGKGKEVEVDGDSQTTDDDDVLPEGLDSWVEKGHKKFEEMQTGEEDAHTWLFMSELWPAS